jgi:hypothetical protein
MLDMFVNPGFLAVAAGLVSVPIIIHLINRMRFKRLRWAAMEFLLKAQKKTRKRLIIEQLLLLAMRCLLIALIGLLALRFVGMGWAGLGGKKGIHVILLDDSLSMSDGWTDKEKNEPRTSFQFARDEMIRQKILKGIVQGNGGESVMVLPMSQLVLDADFEPKLHDKIIDPAKFKELDEEVAALKPTKLHVDVLPALKKAKSILANYPENRATLHILSDFRSKDWGLPEAEPVHQLVKEMGGKGKDLKIMMVDTAHPFRKRDEKSTPAAHDNIGITDLRPGTRVAGKGMPVQFTAVLTNHSSRQADLHMTVFDDNAGREMLEVDFNPPMPAKIEPNSTLTVTFEIRFNPAMKPGEPYFAQVTAALKGLEGDGLEEDNSRQAAVEIREKVPVLVIDGENARGRSDFDKESFFIRTAMVSVPGASYDLVFGDELGGGIATKALERSDLQQYPTIFMLNVRDLSEKQQANLEAYVREGGGVCWFMGPLANSRFFNKLYKEGKGIFPVPLRDTYTPGPTEEPRKTDYTGYDQVMLRDDNFKDIESFPVFGGVFKDRDPKNRTVLKDLPIKRFWQVPRSQWNPEQGKVFELATLPNEVSINNFQAATLDLVRTRLNKILEAENLASYRKAFERHRTAIESLVAPGSDKKAYQLAPALDAMLKDTGRIETDKDGKQKGYVKDFPNLTEFWAQSEPKIASLKKDIERLRDEVRFGDPLIVAAEHGKGRVIAVMTTAGKEWNDWAGGSTATLIYQPFIWETQNWLSSPGSDGILTVGSPVSISMEAEPFKGKVLKVNRTYYKPVPGKPSETVSEGDKFGAESKGTIHFDFDKNRDPGLYVSLLKADDDPKTIASYGHVFNVDAGFEGSLTRVDRDTIEKNLIGDKNSQQGQQTSQIIFDGPGVKAEDLVVRKTDVSESPWFFLLFMGLLVAEQALAVHLSFHVSGNENDALRQLGQPRAKA